MRRRRGLLVGAAIMWAAACTKAPPPHPAAPPDGTPMAAPPEVTPDAAPAPAAKPDQTKPKDGDKPDKSKKCKAGPTECCQPDGTIVKATCDPLESGPARGEGGWCTGCYVRCLPPATLIATPAGERPVSELRAGDLVWTRDAAGRRVAAPIEQVRALPAVDH